MKQVFIILFLVPAFAFAKGGNDDTLMVYKEKEIYLLLSNLRNAKDNKARQECNIKLQNELRTFLKNPDVMNYPFSSWSTMSTIYPEDKSFRIFNWNVESDEGIHAHYCFLVKPNGLENTVIELKEDKITIPPRPENTLTADHWYGAIYYNIVPVKKGNKTYYTVFGYNGGDKSTNKKMLDVFYFKGKTLRMGYPLFQEAPGSQHLLRRVFFEYSEQAIMTLRMNTNLNAIVFDHLVPENPQLEGLYDYYIPDMTYDGYKWEGGVWVYKEDIIAYNTDEEIVKNYKITDDGTRTDVKETDSDWINPVDPNAPNGGGTSAVAPIENVETKKNGKPKRSGKSRGFRITDRLKGPRSAVTGERVKNKRKS